MAKTWSDFYPLLAPHVPGCPDVTMDTYLASTAADFFARTHVWRAAIDNIIIVPNVSEYDLSGDAVIEDIISASIDTDAFEQTDVRLIPQKDRTRTGKPQKFWMVEDTIISVWPIPEERHTVKLTAVLKPSRTATSVPDWIYETWADALVDGAVARLAHIPNKEWTSFDLYAFHKSRYERAIHNAKTRDWQGVDKTVMQRPFA